MEEEFKEDFFFFRFTTDEEFVGIMMMGLCPMV